MRTSEPTVAPRSPRNRPNDRGCLRFDRRFPSLGVTRLQRSSGTTDPDEFRKRNQYLTDLASMGCADEIQAFAAGEIGIDDIERAFKNYDVRGFLREIRASGPAAHSDVELRPAPHDTIPATTHLANDMSTQLALPLWSTAVEEVIPSMGELEPQSRRRYATSIRALQRKTAVFATGDETFEILAGISGGHWEALDLARMRGLTVPRLADLVAMPLAERRSALRTTGVRVGEQVFSALATLPRVVWQALTVTSEYIPDQQLVDALDHLPPDERAALREAARKLGTSPTIGDLAKLTKSDWARFARGWGGSSADWNHMRRSLSAVLTDLFGTPDTGFRRRVIGSIALKAETERVPDLSPELLWRILTGLPPEAMSFPIVLVLTGARISEYERMERRHLRPHTHTVQVPGTKTLGSVRDVRITPEYWPYVDQAVPAPREYGWLRRKWREACAAVGVEGVTLHDLRHCHGQWALQGGAQEQSVQVTLGHSGPAMTRRYTKTLQKGEVAHAVSSVLRASQPR